MDDVNFNDDRVAKLESWLKRKEEEYQTRVNKPPREL
jgi:hypothetical protein